MPNPDFQNVPKISEWHPRRYAPSSMQDAADTDYLAAGSENIMLTGTGKLQAFKGMQERVGETGGIVMQNIVENYASLGQASDVTAYGNVFNVFSALFYIGKGLLKLNGVSLLATASATLSLLIKRSGSYADPLSGPWQAGLAQPSAPVIRAVTPPAGFTGKVNGVVSVVAWRIRSTTGAVSIRSEPSNILACTNQSVAVTLSGVDANGQDYWGIGVTKQAEGRVGSHFEYIEIPESQVAETLVRTDAATVVGTAVTSATGGFTSSLIGWTAVLSGGAPGISHSSYVVGVPDGNTITLNDAAPSINAGTTLTLTRGESGQARTVVIEWRDGDLVGKPYAPSRDFPPPAALFAGALEDITFVDGAYADAVDSVDSATGTRGSAISPSEPGKPESFSPDSIIPTNSIPTALIRGDGVYWRLSRNDLMVLRYLPGENPLSVEIVWEGIGVEHQHNACLGEGGRLYLWPSERGAMRMGENGLPDTQFANPVSDDLAACTDAAKRVVGWYGLMQAVCFCYEKTIWPFFTSQEDWGAPADLTGLINGNIISCIPDNNQLLISTDTDHIYEYNVGTGSVTLARSPWFTSRGGMDTVHQVVASARVDNTDYPVAVRVLADGNPDVIEQEIPVDVPRIGYQRLPSVWPNVIDCESHAVEIEITSTGGDCGLEGASSYGPSEDRTD